MATFLFQYERELKKMLFFRVIWLVTNKYNKKLFHRKLCFQKALLCEHALTCIVLMSGLQHHYYADRISAIKISHKQCVNLNNTFYIYSLEKFNKLFCLVIQPAKY